MRTFRKITISITAAMLFIAAPGAHAQELQRLADAMSRRQLTTALLLLATVLGPPLLARGAELGHDAIELPVDVLHEDFLSDADASVGPERHDTPGGAWAKCRRTPPREAIPAFCQALSLA